MKISDIIATASLLVAIASFSWGVYLYQSAKESEGESENYRMEVDNKMAQLTEKLAESTKGLSETQQKLLLLESSLLSSSADVTLRIDGDSAFYIDVLGTKNLSVKTTALTSASGYASRGHFGVAYVKQCHATTPPSSNVLKSLKCSNMYTLLDINSEKFKSWRDFQSNNFGSNPFESPPFFGFFTLVKVETISDTAKTCRLFLLSHEDKVLREYDLPLNVADIFAKMTATGSSMSVHNDFDNFSDTEFSSYGEYYSTEDLLKDREIIENELKESSQGMCYFNFFKYNYLP